jgi:hypothetical protein
MQEIKEEVCCDCEVKGRDAHAFSSPKIRTNEQLMQTAKPVLN